MWSRRVIEGRYGREGKRIVNLLKDLQFVEDSKV